MTNFSKSLPVWNDPGIEPPDQLKNDGWRIAQRPPASYFDWLQHTTYQALKEIQENATHKTDYLAHVEAYLTHVAAYNEHVDLFNKRATGVVSAKEFGAKGDGINDDADAIQAAVDSKKNVLLPAGTYLISKTILIPNGGRLLGAGMNKTVIKPTAAIPAIRINGGPATGAGVYYWNVEDLTLQGNSIGTIGFEVNYSREGFIKGCRVEGFAKGLTALMSWSNGVHASQIVGNTDVNVELGDQSNDFTLLDCQLDGGGNNGLRITGDSQLVSLFGSVIQSCGKEAILLKAGRAINLNGCYFEKNNTSKTANTPTIRALGDVGQVLGLNITGSQFWDGDTYASISMDRLQGANISGCSFNPIGGGTQQYTFETTAQTFRVFVSGCYKEKPSNDVGRAIISIASGDVPVFNTNLVVRKDSPTLSIDTIAADSYAEFKMNQAGVSKFGVRIEPNGDAYLQHADATGLKNILRITGVRPVWQQNVDFNGNSVIAMTIYGDTFLPTASATYRGQFWRVIGGAGVEDQLYTCKKLSDETYAWVKIGDVDELILKSADGSQWNITVDNTGALTTTKL